MYFFASRCLRLSVVFLCVPALFSSFCDLLLVRQNVATFGGQNFGSFGGQNFGSFPPSGISPPWYHSRSCRASDRPPVVIFGRCAAACSSSRISEAAAAGAGSSARISEAVPDLRQLRRISSRCRLSFPLSLLARCFLLTLRALYVF